MRIDDLRSKISENIFTYLDVVKNFPEESPQLIKIQLSRFAKKTQIYKIKRTLYCFDDKKIDELELANHLYKPSYISLETALNYYGLIPDVPQGVTSVNLITTKKIINKYGHYFYSKISPSLFFGFTKVQPPGGNRYFNLASPEKALLDYIYLRKIKSLKDLRLNLSSINKNLYKEYVLKYPLWVKKIL
jgi:predicted transcriptional regulator of viral defense system